MRCQSSAPSASPVPVNNHLLWNDAAAVHKVWTWIQAPVRQLVHTHIACYKQPCCIISLKVIPAIIPALAPLMLHRELRTLSEHRNDLNLPWLTTGLVAGWSRREAFNSSAGLNVVLQQQQQHSPLSSPLSLRSQSHRRSLTLQGNHRCLWVPQSSGDAANIWLCSVCGSLFSVTPPWHTFSYSSETLLTVKALWPLWVLQIWPAD